MEEEEVLVVEEEVVEEEVVLVAVEEEEVVVVAEEEVVVEEEVVLDCVCVERLLSFDSALQSPDKPRLLKGTRQSFVLRVLESGGGRGIKPNYFHYVQVRPVIVGLVREA